jgi:hypothetical protein
MPEKTGSEGKALRQAKAALRSGKRSTTAAGAFVREEIEHVRQGKHGARSARQAIAIGLSKARRAGVPLKPPGRGQASDRTRRSAERDLAKGKRPAKKVSPRRSRATSRALEREGHSAASSKALSQQARAASHRKKRIRKSTPRHTRAKGD